jgi:hypothetical protein
MWQRLVEHWVYGAFPMAFVLFGLAPFVDIALPLFLALPVYILHQYEEHDNDRFRAYLASLFPPGAAGLSKSAIWMINIVLVWFLLLAVFYLEVANPGWALIAAYLLASNALFHILPALIRRAYNPGLATAIILFLPLAVWLFTTTSGSLVQHATSATVMIAFHLFILVWGRRKAAT